MSPTGMSKMERYNRAITAIRSLLTWWDSIGEVWLTCMVVALGQLSGGAIDGSLLAKMRWDVEGRMTTWDGFAPVTDVLRDYMHKARESKKQMGVVPHNLRYDMLTSRFFEDRPDVYQKALVKLEGANINDTIRFQ